MPKCSYNCARQVHPAIPQRSLKVQRELCWFPTSVTRLIHLSVSLRSTVKLCPCPKTPQSSHSPLPFPQTTLHCLLHLLTVKRADGPNADGNLCWRNLYLDRLLSKLLHTETFPRGFSYFTQRLRRLSRRHLQGKGL